MSSAINAMTTVLILLGVGALTNVFYHSVKKETALRVYRGMHTPMTRFTQKLTGIQEKRERGRMNLLRSTTRNRSKKNDVHYNGKRLVS